ncbi:hypothetical protein D3C71_1646300 [compost metagenome]
MGTVVDAEPYLEIDQLSDHASKVGQPPTDVYHRFSVDQHHAVFNDGHGSRLDGLVDDDFVRGSVDLLDVLSLGKGKRRKAEAREFPDFVVVAGKQGKTREVGHFMHRRTSFEPRPTNDHER